MGLFDTVSIFMKCPYCKKNRMMEGQTKELGNHMFNYVPYEKDSLYTKITSLQIGKMFPYDKEHTVWKNGEEKRKARAKVLDEHTHVKCVNVTFQCDSIECQFDSDRKWILRQESPSGFGKPFDAKIRIKDGMLIGPAIRIKTYPEKFTEDKLSKYKDVDREKYDAMMKKYKHEPIACRNWK